MALSSTCVISPDIQVSASFGVYFLIRYEYDLCLLYAYPVYSNRACQEDHLGAGHGDAGL